MGARVVPDVLKAIYTTFDGAQFHNGVALWKLKDALARTQDLPSGLPKATTFVFGESASGHPLFTAQKKALSEAQQDEVDVADVEDDAWVFGVRRGSKDIRFASSLEVLLNRLVPPAQTEDFGEVTYVHAFSAVHDALRSLQENTDAAAKTLTLAKKPTKKPTSKAAPKRRRPKGGARRG